MGAFDREPTKFRDWIKSVEMYVKGGDNNLSKRHTYQTSKGTVRHYIQRYMVEKPENSWKQLKCELNARFAEVNDPHHAFTMLCKVK